MPNKPFRLGRPTCACCPCCVFAVGRWIPTAWQLCWGWLCWGSTAIPSSMILCRLPVKLLFWHAVSVSWLHAQVRFALLKFGKIQQMKMTATALYCWIALSTGTPSQNKLGPCNCSVREENKAELILSKEAEAGKQVRTKEVRDGEDGKCPFLERARFRRVKPLCCTEIAQTLVLNTELSSPCSYWRVVLMLHQWGWRILDI